MTDTATPLTPVSARDAALARPNPVPADAVDPELVAESIALVRRWLSEAAGYPVHWSASLLADVLKDPKGLGFTTSFVDGVIRPEDVGVAARALARIAGDVPKFVPWYMRLAVRVGGLVGPVLPGIVVPIARKVLREMVGHLVIDATESKLTAAIARVRNAETRLNMNMLGEAVLGSGEAAHRLANTSKLLARDDVDYVSIKVSAVVAPLAPWDFDAAVGHVCEQLTPLFQQAADAAAAGGSKFINLDMEEYHDLDMTIAVFTRLLDRPEFLAVEAGIVLQAYLPDALGAYIRLHEWAAARRAKGGAPIKVRLVKGANLPMETIEADIHGWPLATCRSKQESDTNYLRVMGYAFDPVRTDAIRLGIAGHNLFDIAYAWLLAGKRGVRDAIEFEMLLGMAEGQVAAVKKEVGGVRLYTPAVLPREFDVAIAYLVRRMEEGASSDNFMSAVFDLATDAKLFEREEQRFLGSLAALDAGVPAPYKVADRFAASPRPAPGAYASTPDTDPAIAANRDWVAGLLAAVPGTQAGAATVAAGAVSSVAEMDAVVSAVAEAAPAWAARPAAERSAILHKAGEELEARRGELLEIMAAEGGKTIDQGDPEVSEAIDFAHYYAETLLELEQVDGAGFAPHRVTAVIPPWNFPGSIPAGGALAALATGSGVVFKPARLTRRTGAVVVEALWAAGVPEGVLRYVAPADYEVSSALVANPLVDQVILTGSYDTAVEFRKIRPALKLLGETSGKNAIIITASADMNLAVKDVVYSAFAHAGQKCSACSLVVLVGSAAASRRFRDQIADATASLKVGPASDATVKVGPLIEPPGDKLLRGLTKLEPGQSWLVEPKRVTDTIWTPGVRLGVAPGSEFHKVEYFGPVLGVMTARTLAEAVEIVNAVDYGLTSGLHSLDKEEIDYWLEHIHAGNLYVNRTITGAIVARQPFGGWKKSAVGAGAKAGGPNYLVGLGTWAPAKATGVAASGAPHAAGALVDAAGLAGADAESAKRLAASAAAAMATHFATRDITGLKAEHNVFRYVKPIAPVRVRLAEGAPLADLVKALAAATVSPAVLEVSTPEPLPAGLAEALARAGHTAKAETDAAFADRVKNGQPWRVRLLGLTAPQLAEATGGRPDTPVWDQPVTESGRVELLPFVQEQAVAVTAHRFGTTFKPENRPRLTRDL
jgi:RHH-type proline utilization regulon transcriptional repressor/proline dehydrogenase/delta 1-pyrroline-5-carboxylate dehydrogenase